MIFALYKKVMRKNKQTLAAFKKAIKVINSCENQVHLEGARNYINNFLVSNSKETPELISGRPILKVDSFTESAYLRLQDQLSNREGELA